MKKSASDQICNGMSGVGPCVKPAKYVLLPLWATMKRYQNPPTRWSCGVHLQQQLTAMMADHGPVVVSE